VGKWTCQLGGSAGSVVEYVIIYFAGLINSFKVAFIYLKYVISIKEVNIIIVAKCADYWQVARRLRVGCA